MPGQEASGRASMKQEIGDRIAIKLGIVMAAFSARRIPKKLSTQGNSKRGREKIRPMKIAR